MQTIILALVVIDVLVFGSALHYWWQEYRFDQQLEEEENKWKKIKW